MQEIRPRPPTALFYFHAYSPTISPTTKAQRTDGYIVLQFFSALRVEPSHRRTRLTNKVVSIQYVVSNMLHDNDTDTVP